MMLARGAFVMERSSKSVQRCRSAAREQFEICTGFSSFVSRALSHVKDNQALVFKNTFELPL